MLWKPWIVCETTWTQLYSVWGSNLTSDSQSRQQVHNSLTCQKVFKKEGGCNHTPMTPAGWWGTHSSSIELHIKGLPPAHVCASLTSRLWSVMQLWQHHMLQRRAHALSRFHNGNCNEQCSMSRAFQVALALTLIYLHYCICISFKSITFKKCTNSIYWFASVIFILYKHRLENSYFRLNAKLCLWTNILSIVKSPKLKAVDWVWLCAFTNM